MLAWRAATRAARSRGLAAGSGRPERAAVVNSRMILVNTLARFLSCAPFRYMMFLNCEWPAIGVPVGGTGREALAGAIAPEREITPQYGRIGAPGAAQAYPGVAAAC